MKIIILLLPVLFLSGTLLSHAQIIKTIAGNGQQNYSGDGGPATAAELFLPSGVALDPSGNIYVADMGNNVIRKISTLGIITTFAGNTVPLYSGDGGPATAAELNSPGGVATDAFGNVYIADMDNNRIRKVNTMGIIQTVAGNGLQGFAGDGLDATAAKLNIPINLTLDALGNIYLVDNQNSRIRKVNTSGIINTIAGNGTAGLYGDGGPATAAELNYPVDVAVDASSNIFVAEYNNSDIRKINTLGLISTFAGTGTSGFSGDGNQATVSTLNNPDGVVCDAKGNVYIADFYNNRVRIVNSSGIINTIAGNGTGNFSGDGNPSVSAELHWPSGITLDPTGNLYIGDNGNERVREVTKIPTGMNEPPSSFSQVNVYPVPNSGSFTVMGVTQGQVIELYNYIGQILETRHVLSLQTSMHFDISFKVNGIYLIKILNKEGAVVAEKKIIKTE